MCSRSRRIRRGNWNDRITECWGWGDRAAGHRGSKCAHSSLLQGKVSKGTLSRCWSYFLPALCSYVLTTIEEAGRTGSTIQIDFGNSPQVVITLGDTVNTERYAPLHLHSVLALNLLTDAAVLQREYRGMEGGLLQLWWWVLQSCVTLTIVQHTRRHTLHWSHVTLTLVTLAQHPWVRWPTLYGPHPNYTANIISAYIATPGQSIARSGHKHGNRVIGWL